MHAEKEVTLAPLPLLGKFPFIGGEPTREEQNRVLKAKGFTDTDLAYSALLGAYSQALRSGDMPDTSAESLAKIYPHLADDIKAADESRRIEPGCTLP